MRDFSKIAKQMRDDWNRRVKHDFRFWMSDGYQDDKTMWETGARDLDILLSGIAPTENCVFLEVGCGVGRLLKAASSKFRDVIGLDISEEAINKARDFFKDRTNVKLIVGSGVDLSGIENESVDCVAVFGALSSVPTDVFVSYLIEIQRVMRVGAQARLQVYTGVEQSVGAEDTLHIRCYNETRLKDAVEYAGFRCEGIDEFILPVDVSIESIGIKAKILKLQKLENTVANPDLLAKSLLPQGEKDGKSLDGDIEYWMALNFAKTLVEGGDTERARQALEYAVSVSKAVTIDVSDLLQRIVTEIEKKESQPKTNNSDLLKRNLQTLKRKFPNLAIKLEGYTERVDSGVSITSTKDGPVSWLKGQALDHGEKPVSAAQAWVKRAMQEKRFVECDHIAVVGFGLGYHVESLIRESRRKVSVIEPSLALFHAAMKSRDLTFLLESCECLFIGEEALSPEFTETTEILVRPQSLVTYSEELPRIKQKFYGLRGLKSLKPNILVVGPIQGGTLPIMGYTHRGLLSLNQRSRDLDMSSFNGGYGAVTTLLKEPVRQQAMHANYLELMSQMVLEAAHERKADIVICMAQAPITGRVLTELRAKGVTTVLWFMEDYLRFTYWKDMAKFFDFVFTIQRGECLDLIKAAGAGEVHYLPMACDPVVHYPVELSPEEKARWGSPISFVGAGYHNRQQVFASFAEMPFKIWGTEWPGCKPFDRMVQEDGRRLTPEEYVKIFSSTDININLHSSTERDGVDPSGDFVNPRTFELASCGAFQLCDERNLLGELFEPGREIVTFSSVTDLKEKIDYYLNHPEERAEVAKRARKKVLENHTYGHRLRDMLSIIYSSRYEHLKNRMDASPWKAMLDRAKKTPELYDRCLKAFERGEEANLDGLVVDIMVGQGKLSETEQKLLFLYHIRKQIIRMKKEEEGR